MSKYLTSLSVYRSKVGGNADMFVLDPSILWSQLRLLIPDDIEGYEAQLRYFCHFLVTRPEKD